MLCLSKSFLNEAGHDQARRIQMIRFARLSVSLVVGAAMLAGPAAHAAFPDRPVQMVVGFGPGGGADRVAGLLAPGLSKKWGQQVIVQNKPGVGGVIATEFVAKSAPNGY